MAHRDPFAPYKTGIVFVPGTTTSVVEVSGGYGILWLKVDALRQQCGLQRKSWRKAFSHLKWTRRHRWYVYTIQGAMQMAQDHGNGTTLPGLKHNVTGGAGHRNECA